VFLVASPLSQAVETEAAAIKVQYSLCKFVHFLMKMVALGSQKYLETQAVLLSLAAAF
jgi:hypothetical protein